MEEVPHHAFILVTNKEYWKKLSEGRKDGETICYFIRKNQVGPAKVKELLFYVSKPSMQVLGTADFASRTTGDSQDLWEKYGKNSFFESANEYMAFAEGRRKMTFIRFENFLQISSPLPKEALRSLLGSLVWFRPRFVDKQTAESLIGK